MSLSKSQREKWNDDSLKSAIPAVRKEEMIFKTAAKLHILPRSTLQRYVNPKEAVITSLGRKIVLPRQTEDRVFCYCHIWMLDILVVGCRHTTLRLSISHNK
jgi:hypothetical protein